jgi:7,8-dihydropterin-6-yl-methyl-4-(beta-D-ribofuranosyl)aminobenzene 5'-phosphate synthase
MNLIEVEALKVQVIVDNVTDSLSSIPKNVIHEMDYHEQLGMKELSGECLCCAAHGLSLLLTASNSALSHSILFDAGPEGSVFERNVNKLRIDLAQIEEIVLSHGHWDHAGGFLTALQLIKSKNPKQKTRVHLNPEMFYQRALKFDGQIHPFKKIPSSEELSKQGAELIISNDARLLLSNMFYLRACHKIICTFSIPFGTHL